MFGKNLSLLFILIFNGVLPSFEDMSPAAIRAETQSSKANQPEGSDIVNIISDGQFVYGPNATDFNLQEYLEENAPNLSIFGNELYERSEYFSINPKAYLTLLEIHSQLISSPNDSALANPLGLNEGDFINQIETLSQVMVYAYYQHLYTYSLLPVSERNIEPFITPSGVAIEVPPSVNSGTYAIIAGLAAIDTQNISIVLDNTEPGSFYQTYLDLFTDDNPLDDANQITIPSEITAQAAPDYLLQLPYLRGLSWKFGGVHDNSGCSGLGTSGCQFTDASSMDFYPIGSTWGMDTSNMWVAASASGTPTKISNCYFKILHTAGWETTYYHIENIQSFSGSINQNDKIGVIANTEAEATCSGGAASGPHVHFTLRHNGALVAINGTSLSGWYVHSGRWSYDTDPNYMWLERAGIKKYPYNNVVLSEAYPPSPSVLGITGPTRRSNQSPNIDFTVTFSQSVTGVDETDFQLVAPGLPDAVITGVSGSGISYMVSINTGSGKGSVHLNLIDNDTIVNDLSSPLGGAGLNNGNFTTGDTYPVVIHLPDGAGAASTGGNSKSTDKSVSTEQAESVSIILQNDLGTDSTDNDANKSASEINSETIEADKEQNTEFPLNNQKRVSTTTNNKLYMRLARKQNP